MRFKNWFHLEEKEKIEAVASNAPSFKCSQCGHNIFGEFHYRNCTATSENYWKEINRKYLESIERAVDEAWEKNRGK